MTKRQVTRRTLLTSSVLAFAAPAVASAPVGYRDRCAPIGRRVEDLLRRMTLDEKVAQLRSMWLEKVSLYDGKGDFSPEKARTALVNGIGQIARPSDYRGLPRFDDRPFRTIANTADFVNAVQRHLVEHTRLGIPALFHDELAHGLLAGDATVFPTPTALASTFDVALVEEVFTVAAREARSRGTNIALTPVVDLLRDPRYGRSEEFFSEDPFLVGEMGLAAVRGLQGRTRPIAHDRVFCTLKHFVHGTPQGGLNIAPAEMGPHTLRETYLAPFAQVLRHVDAASIMPSYNSVDGIPSHDNVRLLNDVGRGLLGFRGIYQSDYGGVENLVVQHRVAASKDEASILALNAGISADLPEGASFAGLSALVRAGRVPIAQIDEAVSRILSLKFEAGLFERPYVDGDAARRTFQSRSHAALARRAAERSVVLLKNEGVLPLDPSRFKRLAVIGPNAIEPLTGGYSGDNAGSVGILAGIRESLPEGLTVEHADGVWITAPDVVGRHRSYSKSADVPPAQNDARIAEAVAVASRSDVVLLVLGDVPSLTREAVAWDLPGDRSTLGLWGQQDELVEAIAKVGKPIIALLLNGRPLAVPALASRVQGLFEGWYLGQEGGRAFADILFGRVNPSGKLPVSMPRSAGELPYYYDRAPSADTNHYIEGRRAALYPFGHGLSYTTFEVSKPRLEQATIATSDTAVVLVDVQNTGARAGDEVVQLYMRDDLGSTPRPVLQLVGFERVSLAPGEMRTVRLLLPPERLACWSIDLEYVVEPGTFTIHAGSNSVDLSSTTLTVTGSAHQVRFGAPSA